MHNELDVAMVGKQSDLTYDYDVSGFFMYAFFSTSVLCVLNKVVRDVLHNFTVSKKLCARVI